MGSAHREVSADSAHNALLVSSPRGARSHCPTSQHSGNESNGTPVSAKGSHRHSSRPGLPHGQYRARSLAPRCNIADAVLASGDRLVATARDPRRLEDLVKKYGDLVRTAPLDVVDEEAAHETCTRRELFAVD